MNDAMHHGTAGADNPHSSLDAQTLVRLKRMLLFTNEDEQYLIMAGNILAAHTEDILDTWYHAILKNNYLAHYFTRDGAPDMEYLQSLRPQFRKWIRALCTRQEGQSWWQFEKRIAAQVRPEADNDMEPLPLVYLRYLSSFIYPITEAGRPYLNTHGHPSTDVERMQQAWFKAVSFSVLLWVYPSPQHPLF
ncbi:protoglobin domain-containing protein [Chitinophaga arvensicola]|uniref:Protoglobin n=1 Tax=Chitinophaga arvensicola TaxID=29529 RepID=A0A1I0PWG3_9BACT|nr:protoglobin domain-containing protein [Chitinophaga arvensicola]SEW18469.1 Protoglobin [Chitinophaga arvensicola]